MLSGRRRTQIAVIAALVGALIVGGCGSDPATVARGPAHSSATLRIQISLLRTQANVLLDGGLAAFASRLGSLRGVPVVVNQWASWCGPCRYEFPFFEHLAERYAGRVAFIGVNSQDNRADAQAFLRRFPVSYPHYYDKDASVARTFRGGRSWPTTAFYAASGKLAFTHIGSYATEAKLEADIRGYALHG